MNQVKKIILEDVVQPELNKRPHMTTGTIEAYYPNNNRVDITFTNPNSGSLSRIENVIYPKNTRGMHPAEPMPGNRVFVSFDKNDYTNPVIVGVFDENYNHPSGSTSEIKSFKGVMMSDYMSFL